MTRTGHAGNRELPANRRRGVGCGNIRKRAPIKTSTKIALLTLVVVASIAVAATQFLPRSAAQRPSESLEDTALENTPGMQNPFMPLVPGYSWKYRISTGGEMTRKVTRQVTESPAAFEVLTVEPNSETLSIYEVQDDGRVTRVESRHPNDEVYRRFEPPYTVAVAMAKGANWDNRFDVVKYSLNDKQGEIVTKDYEFRCRVLGEETVKVPAGTFKAFVIEGPDVTDREWDARGVGMVKWSGKEGTYELTEFSQGKK